MDLRERKTNNWYRLDNAAKLYPSVCNWKWSAMFRVSALMKENVDSSLLQQALELVLKRFPNFSLKMRTGIFWYYFEDNAAVPRVQPDTVNPCIRISHRENSGYMFRVRTFGRRIALEVFHALTDGYGALIFLKTLIAQYLRLCGQPVPATDGVLDIHENSPPEEMEDSFKKYSTLKILRSRKESRAYHFNGTSEPPDVLNIITGILPLDTVLEKAREYKVSLTEYLVAALVFILYGIQEKENIKVRHPIKVTVPINMRNFYPTSTMRNFALFINPGIDPDYGEYTFEEILTQIHYFMRFELNKKLLNAQMSKNVSSERNIFIRLLPLFLKNLLMGFAYRMTGESRVTSTLSNIGAVVIPKEMKEHVERFDALLGPSLTKNGNVVVLSYDNSLVITFTRTIKETDVEREFFTFLVKKGIPVEIESNRE